jgi:hypothetical protein
MTQRWNAAKRLKLLELVVERYASVCGWRAVCCLICGKTDFKPRELTLDHLDNNKRTNLANCTNRKLYCCGGKWLSSKYYKRSNYS